MTNSLVATKGLFMDLAEIRSCDVILFGDEGGLTNGGPDKKSAGRCATCIARIA